MTIAITGVHPYADKYPMLPESELIELAESIAANGLRSAVVVTPDGLILDGRNRAAACKRAGVAPERRADFDDEVASVFIAELRRTGVRFTGDLPFAREEVAA